MGESLSKIKDCVENSAIGDQLKSWTGKRPREDDDDSDLESNSELEKELHTPKRPQMSASPSAPRRRSLSAEDRNEHTVVREYRWQVTAKDARSRNRYFVKFLTKCKGGHLYIFPEKDHIEWVDEGQICLSSVFCPDFNGRRKTTSTSKYIYRALFEEGKNSDVTVIALGRRWLLHKVYLCQSPYFASMFSGAWKEALQDTIDIEIADPNINLDALTIVLGALYQDDLVVEPAYVVSILAAATLFQMEAIIEQSMNIMLETVNIQTVTKYYEAACEYGVPAVKEACLKWLRVNLLSAMHETPKRLREIKEDLMEHLVKDPELFVVQTEFSLYVILKLWLYLRLHPMWEGSHQEAMLLSHRYFQERKTEDCPFLLSAEGMQYLKVFQGLRFQHLLNHYLDVEMMHTDKVLPSEWLTPYIKLQWYQMLRVDQGIDKGPRQLSKEDFLSNCLRCGRCVPNAGEHLWRWTGFNFGLDLIMHFTGRVLKIRRNHRNDHEIMISQLVRRHIMYRVTVVSIDAQRQVKHKQTTEIKSIGLPKNQEVAILELDDQIEFPVLLSVNLVVVTPPVKPLFKQTVSQVDISSDNTE